MSRRSRQRANARPWEQGETPEPKIDKNRPARESGGCECTSCGVIFIGEPWHDLCGVCHAEDPPVATEPTRCPNTGDMFEQE